MTSSRTASLCREGARLQQMRSFRIETKAIGWTDGCEENTEARGTATTTNNNMIIPFLILNSREPWSNTVHHHLLLLQTVASLFTRPQQVTMSTAQGNIFLTTENLAFSLPLLIVCGSYVSSNICWLIRFQLGKASRFAHWFYSLTLCFCLQLLPFLKAYFKYVPLKIGGPILLGIFVLYQIRAQIIARKWTLMRCLSVHDLGDVILYSLCACF